MPEVHNPLVLEAAAVRLVVQYLQEPLLPPRVDEGHELSLQPRPRPSGFRVLRVLPPRIEDHSSPSSAHVPY